MTTPRPELPPVLLGPESGRKVAEHIEPANVIPKSLNICQVSASASNEPPNVSTYKAPDPRDEAVGLLREVRELVDNESHVMSLPHFYCGRRLLKDFMPRIRSLLARIDK